MELVTGCRDMTQTGVNARVALGRADAPMHLAGRRDTDQTFGGGGGGETHTTPRKRS